MKKMKLLLLLIFVLQPLTTSAGDFAGQDSPGPSNPNVTTNDNSESNGETGGHDAPDSADAAGEVAGGDTANAATSDPSVTTNGDDVGDYGWDGPNLSFSDVPDPQYNGVNGLKH